MLRYQGGNWILGFNRYLGKCLSFEVELWSILDGLLILLSKGYRQATIQTDNIDVVQTLNDIGLEDSGITLCKRLRQITRIKRQWQIRHVPREHNSVANRLAKLSLTWKSNLQVFDVAPIEIFEILKQDDASGFTRNIGSCSVLMVELLGILDGLQIAWNL
ncbi:hypothetical protein Godav_004678 [Gossypium davidsonii]|uniref:RNase H type-1 domain-containing protein n=2 Tax=Gossypium TaxID=3633 RepID=A0A7J8SM27_GOSDV|nr:hypothetical protein [Gossypium davidsonii]